MYVYYNPKSSTAELTTELSLWLAAQAKHSVDACRVCCRLPVWWHTATHAHMSSFTLLGKTKMFTFSIGC